MARAIQIFFVIVFNIALLFSLIAIPALLLSTSTQFYEWGLRETGIYSHEDENGKIKKFKVDYIGGSEDMSAIFEDDEIDIIRDHIIDFMSGEKESFLLILNGVHIVGVGKVDGVQIFGNEAISHMEDVISLVRVARILSVISAATVIVGIVCYIIFTRRLSVSVHKISLIFYSALLIICALFVFYSYAVRAEGVPFLLNLWQNLHYVIFPFQESKVEGSVLFDALAVILSTEFFIRAVIIIFGVLLVTVVIWLVFSYFFEKKREFSL